MAHDVFISYSHIDVAVTNAICHRLEENGIRCWYAPRDIRAGANFDTALVQAIKNTRVFVLVFSEKSGQSNYVHQEVRTAFEAGKLVIPFRIANTMPEGGMELLLKGFHWLDAIDPPLDAHIDRLLETVSVTLGIKVLVQPVDPSIHTDSVENTDKPDGRNRKTTSTPKRKVPIKENVKFCSVCGMEISEHMIFCPGCGTKLDIVLQRSPKTTTLTITREVQLSHAVKFWVSINGSEVGSLLSGQQLKTEIDGGNVTVDLRTRFHANMLRLVLALSDSPSISFRMDVSGVIATVKNATVLEHVRNF